MRRGAVTVGLGLWLASSSVAAQSDRAAAEALFKAGRRAMRAGDFAAACPKFEESQRLDPAPGTVLNLADCEARLGRIASAWQRYVEATESLPERDVRRELAERRARELEAELPRLLLRLAGGEVMGELKISVDGVPLGAAAIGEPLPMDPGTRRVVVQAAGHAERSYEVELARGRVTELELARGAKLSLAPGTSSRAPRRITSSSTSRAPARAPEPANDARRSWAIVSGGVGVAGLALSAVGAAFVLDRKSTVSDQCRSDRLCSEAGLDAAASGRTWSTVATTAFALGVVGVGVGVWLWTGASGGRVSATARAGATGGAIGLDAQF
jgi:hypothetical protein